MSSDGELSLLSTTARAFDSWDFSSAGGGATVVFSESALRSSATGVGASTASDSAATSFFVSSAIMYNLWKGKRNDNNLVMDKCENFEISITFSNVSFRWFQYAVLYTTQSA